MIETSERVANRYRVIKKLGSGGFGQIFEVIDEWNNSHKVLKVLNPNSFQDKEHQEKAIELLEREYQVLKELHHPGIPAVETDAYFKFVTHHPLIDQTDTILHGLVMEMIEGLNLLQWLKINHQLQNEQIALNWLKQMSEILTLIHYSHYFHRDLKPENIMLKKTGDLVLIDFGAVKEESQIVDKNNNLYTVIGTSGYSSPEQLLGRNITNQSYRSDFYSLGRTLVHLLTGESPQKLPVDINTNELVWRDRCPQISERLKDLIDWLMEYEPQDRPANTKVILQEIKAIKQKNDPMLSFTLWLSAVLNLVFYIFLYSADELTIGLKIILLLPIVFILYSVVKYQFQER